MERADENTGYALVAIAASAWGTWPLFLRAAEAGGRLDPAVESAFAMALLTLVSGAFCLRDRVRARPRVAHWLGIAWLGFADAMNIFLFFRAYQTTSVAIAVMTHYLAPMFVAVSAPLVLRERLTMKTVGAVAASFLGLILLLSPGATSDPTRADGLGAALGAASAAFYASNVIVNKYLTPVFSGSELSFYHGLVATPVLLALVPSGAASTLSAHAVTLLFAGSLVAGAMGGLLFVWGLRRVEATRAANLTLLEPLVAVLSAWVFLHEQLTLGMGLGGALILLGAALVIVR